MTGAMASRVLRELEELGDQAEARLVSALLSISKSTRALVGLKLSELGFHNGQDELLCALDERSEMSVSKIADELCVRASTVSKMLDRLVAAEWPSGHRTRPTRGGRWCG